MYSPKIAEDLIPELYTISKASKKPMTKVVDEFLRLGLQIAKITKIPGNGGNHESNHSTCAGRNKQP